MQMPSAKVRVCLSSTMSRPRVVPVQLVRQLGGDVAGAMFLIELGLLQGRRRLAHVPLTTLLTL
jgi:hypothetical protein